MASPLSNVRPTTITRFDTLAVDTGSRQQRSIYQRKVYSYTNNLKSQPKGKRGILHGFSRFVAGLTGEDEIYFQFAVRSDVAASSNQEVVFAAVSQDNVELEQRPHDGEHFDFGLEILADLDDFDLTDSLLLDCPFIVQYHIAQHTVVMHYDIGIMDDTFADVMFNVLIKEISRTRMDDSRDLPKTQLSVLNHPPMLRPAQTGQVQLLHAGFQRAAAQYANRHALHFRSDESTEDIFTYQELESLSTALAIKLRNHIGITHTQPIVPAFMGGSTAFYVSWLAVLKAGFAFCPLPMDAPSEQLRGIVEEVGASLVLTNGILIGGSPWDAWYCDDDELATCIDVADFVKTYEPDEDQEASLPAISESDLAYVMYTSGSTGRPKGVKIHHLAAACSIASHSKFISPACIKDGFRWFQFAAPTFDPSIMEIFTTWWTGGTPCGTPREMLLTDPEGTINNMSATIMMATPSMASVLRPEKLHLRHLWTMGEKLTSKVIQNFSSDSPLHSAPESHTPSLQRPYKLSNFYGPTEASINCTVVPDFSAKDRGSIIGRPIETCSILVIDPESRIPVPVPLGFSGELAIGGPQVSQGYLNRAEQTAAVLVSSAEYGRLYRTGDRARVVRSKSGELFVEFLGRITTDQVKLSGRRVELGQIESVISNVPGISDAVTTVHQYGPSGQGSEQIVAFVVADQIDEEQALRNSCEAAAEQALPLYMRPAKYIFLEEMPQSRSGKTDRKALAALAQEKLMVNSESELQGPDLCTSDERTDQTLETIIEALSAVCDVSADAISPGIDLLSLGLDSLRAIRFLQQLRDQGIARLTVTDVLKIRSPAGLARHCSTESYSASTASVSERLSKWDSRLALFDRTHRTSCANQLGIHVQDIESVLPTTATQSGMIASFLRSMSSARRKYINHSVYHQTPGIDDLAVENAWRTALTLPKILRTVFTSVDDELSPFGQCVLKGSADNATFELKLFHCADDTQEAWDKALETAKSEAEVKISLERPPFRLAIIRSPSRTAYLLSLFHGIFDGGSLELIIRDVEDAFFSRPAASRTEMDVAVRAHFSQASEQTAAYWQSQYKGYELNPFPCVSAFKPETQTSAAVVTEVISNITLDRIMSASKNMSASPLSLLQAAWANILLAYTGSTGDVSFGSVISDRLEVDLASCMGPTFVVAPVKLSHARIGSGTTREVLSMLTSGNADALPHHHIPLSSLTTADGGLPYDTLLAFQAFDKSTKHTIWESIDYPAMEHDFAVMIEIWPMEAGSLRLRATHTHKHLDPAAAMVMLQQLDSLLKHMCENPDDSFGEVRFAVRSELRSHIPAIREQSSIKADRDADVYLHQPFQRHALATPTKPALLFKQAMDGSLPDIEWSYGEMYFLALRFAAKLLKECGFVPNEPIMICMEKCPELYVAVLGILLAGAGWCPIDPYSPPARQRAIMERTGSRILVSSSTAPLLDEAAIPEGVCRPTVDLAVLQTENADQSNKAIQVDRDPSHLAYLIFTSGTTGLPKGVPITHLSGAMAMKALTETIPSDVQGREVRCMQFSQYTFDVFVQDLFYTFALGGTVISSTRQVMLQSFAELANKTSATHAHLTPAFAATLSRSSIKTLEVVTMIGEKLTEAVAEDWSADMRSYNTYGPAEATVVSTVRQFTGRADEHHSSNVGTPMPTVGTYVVDDGNVVMRGAIGELALAGPQLSPGYWQLPEVNAKKFVWNDKLQQRLYLTGDLVRHLADGTINFLGRNDDLVKLGGQRVELGEIAFALKDADPRIEKFEALLCKRKTGEGHSLVAFMACPSLAEDNAVSAITGPEARALVDVAQEYGRTMLPPYMQPSAFVVLNRIPQTASAKVDRSALTAIYHSLDTDDYQSISDPAKHTLNDGDAMWRKENAEMLSLLSKSLGVSTDSFRATSRLAALGIDSITAIRLVPKINKLGFNISVIDVFQCKTISDLCQLTERSTSGKVSEAVEQHPDSVLQRFDAKYYKQATAHLSLDDFSVIPATVLQESLLSESLKEPKAYWSSHLFQLHDDIDISRLRRSWIKVARNTEALRAGFLAKAALQSYADREAEAEHGFLQIIYDEPHGFWHEQTITGNIEIAARNRVSEVAHYHHQEVFKLPPWSVDLIRHKTVSVMMITIHHSVYDGPSLALLEADVRAQYDRSFKQAMRLPWSEAVASRSVIDADSDAAVEFWKTSLQDFVSATGQEDGSLADQGSTKLQHRILYMRSKVSFSKLREAMVQLGLSSIVTILRTVWGIVLADLLESSQVLFAEVLSDRVMDSKLDTAIGPLMSVVPSLYVPKCSVSETLISQDSFAKQAWTHRNVRPGTIKTLLNRGSNSQVYPAMFAFQPSAGDDANAHDLWDRLEDVTNIQVEHPLALNVWQDSENCPRFELAVADTLMSEAEQYLLLQQLDALIEAMIGNPKGSLTSLTKSMPNELISKTTPRPDTQCPAPYSPVHWVEHWAKTHPEWKAAEIALDIGLDGTKTIHWTYAELLTESNRIARLIIGRGFSGRKIGMCLGRTLTSFAVALGIMISGNAYLPIDEAFPAERKGFLLEDSDAGMVFSTSELFDAVSVLPGCELVNVDTDKSEQELAAFDASNLPRQGHPGDDAYLLYTSGSTGKPKGVLVSQENLASFVQAQSEFICDNVPATKELGGRGKYLGLASRAFDVHIGEMFLAWRHGLAIVTGNRSMLLDDLALALSSLHISHASFVPSLLDQTGLSPEDAPDLVFLGVGGEKMSPKTKKKWGAHDRVGLINAYGPTEATIGCCSGRLYPDSDMRDIGMPLGDSVGHVLVPGINDYALRGMPGELCFTGSLIANGYLNRPDAKGFVEDFQGQKMYRTGDIVRLTIDDHIHFLGRKDDQVKIRGQRVELGEVAEGVRMASDCPVDVAALVIKHPELSRVQLVAFIAHAQSSKRKPRDLAQIIHSELQHANTVLRSSCQKSLPAYMVPDLVVPLDYIPLTATSGKSDGKLLTQVFSSIPISQLTLRDSSNGSITAASARPLNDAEEKVWALIASVVKDKPQTVSSNTTVFELGIDSLAAISVFSKLRSAGYNCSVAMVMRNPTIEQLAQSSKHLQQDASRESPTRTEDLEQIRQRLRDMQNAFLRDPHHSIDPCKIEAVRPCLPLQETLVGSSMHDDSYGAYINHIRFAVGADINTERLRDAWGSLTHDNEILRTCFAPFGDTFVQVVLKKEALELDWAVSNVPASDSLAAIQKMTAEDIVRNLGTRPPIRLTYLPAEDGGELLLSISHAIYDGNSLEMMFHDLKCYYDGKTPTPRPGVRPLVEYISAQSQEQAQNYWKALLSEWESAPLLSETTTKDVTLSTSKRRFRTTLSSLESGALSLGVTSATLLQFTFAISLSQTLKTNDFIFGNVLSGRIIPVDSADRIMAPCVTTIPQRVRLTDPKASLADELKSLQASNSASLDFQHISPRAIQRWLKADRPLYDILFSFIRINTTENQESPLLQQKSSDIAVDYPLAIEFEADVAKDQLTVSVGSTPSFGTFRNAELLLERIEMLTQTIRGRSDLTVQSLGLTGRQQATASRELYDENSWTPLENQVRSLIAEFADVSPQEIYKDTAFIHLGIDSISAIRLAKHLRKAGLKASSADVVRHNRLGALCKYLDTSTTSPLTDHSLAHIHFQELTNVEKSANTINTHEALLSALYAAGVKHLTQGAECYECTPLQGGMLAQSLATDGALYMHHHAIECKGDIDIDRLKRAWDAVVDDLDVMRTTFHWLPKHTAPWVAVVHSDKRPTWTEVEVVDAREHWLQLSEQSDFNARIQDEQPLAGARLVESDGQPPVLILSLHHAIYDGISLGMVFRQLSMRYHDAASPQLTPFYEAARTIVRSADSAVGFWAKQIKGYEGAPSTKTTNSFSLAERVVTTDVCSLEAKCRTLDLDIKDVATVAFGKAMMKAFSRRDVVFGQVVAARLGQLGDRDIVGPVFNTIPFRVTLEELLSTNMNMVDIVHGVNLNSIELQHASLAEVQKRWRQTAVDPSAPLIDSIFVFSKLESGGEYGLDTLGSPLESDKAPVPSEYRLNFEVEHTESSFTARVLSSAPTSEIHSLLEHFSLSMHDIVDNPDRFAAAFPEGLRDLPLRLAGPTGSSLTTFDDHAVGMFAGTIRNAMAEVAEVAPSSINLESSIYSFGIDSIAAIQIVSRCKKAGLRISVAQILKGAVLGRICELVANTEVSRSNDTVKPSDVLALVSEEHQDSALSTLKLSREAVEEVLPCLPGQEYHLMSWLQSGRTLYEPGWVHKSASSLDVDRLREAWSRLIQRNAVLRTTFAAVGPQKAVQIVVRSGAIQDDGFVVHQSLDALTDAVKSRAFEEARKPSTMFSVPVRLRLTQAKDGNAIMLYCHHSLYDAWSMPRLVMELAKLYSGVELPEVPPFSRLVRHTVQSINEEEESTFWKENLAGCEKAIITSSHLNSDWSNMDRKQTFVMTESNNINVADLEVLCNKYHISPHHMLLLAFCRALAKDTDTRSPLFGFFQLGRSAVFDNIEAVTGPCVNVLPLGVRSPLSRPVLDAARQLQQMLGARVPFEQSSLRTAIAAFDGAATQLPFNAYVNVLWNTKSLVGEVADDDLFTPMALGVPTDYSSEVVLEGKTAVDGLDTSLLPDGQLFMDIGRGENGVVFGVRADAKLMDEAGVNRFIKGVEDQIGECFELLKVA